MAEVRTILFSGRVQGVGFRMTAVHFASGLALDGTVRNLPDGRVEIIVAGEPAEIDGLASRLREHFGSFVRNVDQSVSDPVPGGKRGRGLRVVE
jgi:acylphosphatase